METFLQIYEFNTKFDWTRSRIIESYWAGELHHIADCCEPKYTVYLATLVNK